jgi:hypothetical protein
LGNLGISAILVSALRVSGSGVNFFRLWVLFYVCMREKYCKKKIEMQEKYCEEKLVIMRSMAESFQTIANG